MSNGLIEMQHPELIEILNWVGLFARVFTFSALYGLGACSNRWVVHRK